MYKHFKRLCDITLGFTLLIILSPLLLLIMFILRFSGEGEVFYLQKRIGLNNSNFYIWKFATMLKNSLNMGTGSITLQNDFRVTRIGRFLRKTKLNELPQLINVLKGDLSLVGPRPLVGSTFNAYNDEVKDKIYKIRPGITGIGSIVYRDEERIISKKKPHENPHEYYNRIIAPYKGELEIWYQENQTFTLDLKILVLTAIVIIFPKTRLHEQWFKTIPRQKNK